MDAGFSYNTVDESLLEKLYFYKYLDWLHGSIP
jgi:hypothetical protein